MPMYFDASDLVYHVTAQADALGSVSSKVISVSFRVRGAEEVGSKGLLKIGELGLSEVNLASIFNGDGNARFEAIFDSAEVLMDDEDADTMVLIDDFRIEERYRSQVLARDVIAFAIRHFAPEADIVLVNARSKLSDFLVRAGFIPLKAIGYVGINPRVKPLIGDIQSRYPVSLGHIAS
jgi:hypothetical protein